MKKRSTQIYLSLLLLLSLLAICISCGNATADETTESLETTAPITSAEPISFSITADYKLVRPDAADELEIEALQLLARGIKSIYGFSCQMVTDFKKPQEELIRNEFEILIGGTNRDESIALAEELAYYDWDYRVYNENIIAICGGSPEATYNAVASFLSSSFGYSEDPVTHEVISAGSDKALGNDIHDSYRHTYSVTSLKLGEHDISEYSVVTTSSRLAGTDDLVYGISRLCGVNIPVISKNEYKSGPAIFLGCGKEDGSHVDAEVYGRYRYFITDDGSNIFIDFTTSSVSSDAVSRFLYEYLPEQAEGECTVSLGKSELITGLSLTSGTNGLTLSAREAQQIADGISYEEHLYLDKNGAPVRAYMVIVKDGAGVIQTTMPSDDPEKLGKVSNMKNQLNAAISNGKNAIAAVNADFFDMGGTNVMRGLCIKDGILVSGAGDRPWFGITNDGKAVMGTSDDYGNYKGKLTTGVGGSHILLKNDNPSNLAVGTDFADTRHPRTAVGVTPNGDIVLLVVDGRQPNLSNGASLADLAEILGILGCSEGINLDGGGSSTLILKESSGLNTKNSPSAGALRAVADGLMVVIP